MTNEGSESEQIAPATAAPGAAETSPRPDTGRTGEREQRPASDRPEGPRTDDRGDRPGGDRFGGGDRGGDRFGGGDRGGDRFGGGDRDRGDRPFRPRGGGGGGFRGRGGGRKKVCAFCVDKIDRVDYKDALKLRRYITERGKIEPRRKTGTCARHQRRLTIAIKRARHLALLPYTADHSFPGDRR
ncbi:MAG: 30S ribosomal protein S18 [Dehalococcoidia bacterium]